MDNWTFLNEMRYIYEHYWSTAAKTKYYLFAEKEKKDENLLLMSAFFFLIRPGYIVAHYITIQNSVPARLILLIFLFNFFYSFLSDRMLERERSSQFTSVDSFHGYFSESLGLSFADCDAIHEISARE